MTYTCSSSRCGWTGSIPWWKNLSTNPLQDDVVDPDGPKANERAPLCPKCFCPARCIGAPRLALPILSRVPATPELIGGLELALSVLEVEFNAGRLAPGSGPQINELRSLHVQLLANRKQLEAGRAA